MAWNTGPTGDILILGSVLKGFAAGARRSSEAPSAAGDAILDAVAAYDAGRHREAMHLLEHLLSAHAEHAEARYLLGLWHGQAGRVDDALVHLAHAVRLAPRHADAYLALGNVYKGQNKAGPAEDCYRRVLALDADAGAAHHNLALVLAATGRRQEALVHFTAACTGEPYIESARRERIFLLLRLGRMEEALSVARTAVDENPESACLWACLAMAHHALYDLEAARQCWERSSESGAVDAELQTHMGMLLYDLGDVQAARTMYDRALQAKPGDMLARFHRALLDLALGRFESAWKDYELRLLSEDRPRLPQRFPPWQGASLTGKSILVTAEQGLGDEIMFASCLAEIVQSAGRCLFTCSPRLVKLFARSFPRVEVLGAAPGEIPAGVEADVQMAAGSLPLYLRRSSAAFPRHTGYLRADSNRVAYWRSRLDALGSGLKVGLSWQGGSADTRRPLRSLRLTRWAPIFDVPGVRWISLQYGEGAVAREAGAHDVVHWQEAIDDYDETAALVTALDLTVSVCTAVVHLAGALGRPVWIMAPASPEWRYGHGTRGMPWYPSAVLYRQRQPGEWTPVVAEVAADLRRAVAGPEWQPHPTDTHDAM